METPNNNRQSDNHSIRLLDSLKRYRASLGIMMTAAVLCAVVALGLSTSSIAQNATTTTDAVMEHPGWVQFCRPA